MLRHKEVRAKRAPVCLGRIFRGFPCVYRACVAVIRTGLQARVGRALGSLPHISFLVLCFFPVPGPWTPIPATAHELAVRDALVQMRLKESDPLFELILKWIMSAE
jgi:hypothetical protein